MTRVTSPLSVDEAFMIEIFDSNWIETPAQDVPLVGPIWFVNVSPKSRNDGLFRSARLTSSTTWRSRRGTTHPTLRRRWCLKPQTGDTQSTTRRIKHERAPEVIVVRSWIESMMEAA